MKVRFTRGGGGPGGYSEVLEVADDGTFTMRRRESGRRSGRFAGSVGAATVARLDELAAGARAEGEEPAGPAHDDGTDLAVAPPPVTPDSSHESVDLGDVGRSFGMWDEAGGAWGELRQVLQQLMDTLLDQPVSALELSVGAEGPGAVLSHAGVEPVRLAGGAITARATLMDGQSRTLATWRHQIEVDEGEVGPGWSLDLGLGPEAFTVEPGTGYLASVSVPVVVGTAHDTWTLHGTGGEGWDQ